MTFISQGSVTAFVRYRIQFPTLCLVPDDIDGEGKNSQISSHHNQGDNGSITAPLPQKTGARCF